jgi:hypothetical protein
VRLNQYGSSELKTPGILSLHHDTAKSNPNDQVDPSSSRTWGDTNQIDDIIDGEKAHNIEQNKYTGQIIAISLNCDRRIVLKRGGIGQEINRTVSLSRQSNRIPFPCVCLR